MIDSTVCGEGAGRILCVDDEPNILASLRRLFRGQGYEVQTRESGQAGLELLESERFDLVISDMRMPEMDGVEFLEQVRQRWPDTLRLLLTGHADVRLILDAINRGEIYRYITKPWDENDILLMVRHAFERKALEREKQRLEALTQHQNELLRELNANLEAKVTARTVELKKVHDELLGSHEKLKRNFITSIKVFSNIIEMRENRMAGHSRRVADLARRIAGRLELDARETQQIFIAALLHNLGKVGFSDEMIDMPLSMMNGERLGAYRSYPARGEQLMMPLDDLREAAAIVRAHQERFDGEGFPDGLAGLEIPLGARILALASDYDNLQIGIMSQRQLRPDQAAALIVESSGKRYDPSVVTAFQETISGRVAVDTSKDLARSVVELRPGMRMARDLVTRDGALLLSADHVLSERMIRQIAEYEKTSKTALTLYVRAETENP
jgi:response regulator RpfG family c-di-GMP phosphodiesterase